MVISDRYELNHPVAKGGMGEVWAGHDRQLVEMFLNDLEAGAASQQPLRSVTWPRPDEGDMHPLQYGSRCRTDCGSTEPRSVQLPTHGCRCGGWDSEFMDGRRGGAVPLAKNQEGKTARRHRKVMQPFRSNLQGRPGVCLSG
ncbi:hypothetical protein GCM10023074_60370 [Microbispora amethystogenes]|uniref:Uncharacterized protein n=1 Tax=Microbispora amethystogenes TaxID=1427754 RepID=A0ABQ4FN71_9ACTN|nr:hypothetical protein Mam01_64380 [Microbispora amethystogenes]